MTTPVPENNTCKMLHPNSGFNQRVLNPKSLPLSFIRAFESLPRIVSWFAVLMAFIACQAISPILTAAQPQHGWVTNPVEAPGVVYGTFFSEAAGQAVSYHVLLPPGWDESANLSRSYPAVYYLHGSGAPTTTGIPIVSQMFRNAMLSGEMPEALVVFPNGLPEGMYVDAKDGSQPAETIIIQELIPHIEAAYRAIPDRQARIAEGWSMGGYGAGRFAFKFPDLFAAGSMLGAGPLQLDLLADGPGLVPFPVRLRIFNEVFGGDQEYFEAQSPWRLAEQYASAPAYPVRLRIALGDADFVFPANEAFHAHLLTLGIAHEWHVFEGLAHQAPAVLSALQQAGGWAFYQEIFGDAVSAGPAAPEQPAQLMLLQNYPNPFNNRTVIRFELAESAEITLSLHDLQGRQIGVLTEGARAAGAHQHALDASGFGLPSGVYLLQLRAGQLTDSLRITLLK